MLPRGILVDTLLLAVTAMCNRIPITTHLTLKAILPFGVVLNTPPHLLVKSLVRKLNMMATVL